MNHPCNIALTAALFCCAPIASAGSTFYTIDDQSRTIEANTAAQAFSLDFSDSDSKTAPDTAAFDESVAAQSIVNGGTADASAEQLSGKLIDDRLYLSGSVNISTQSVNAFAQAQADASSDCAFELTFPIDIVYRIQGGLTAETTGPATDAASQAAVSITTPTSIYYQQQMTHKDASPALYDHASYLNAGTYTFAASASVDAGVSDLDWATPTADYEFAIEFIPYCAADANLDLVVNVNDISTTIFHLGETGNGNFYLYGDATRDGIVDVNDITYILFRLGDSCP